MICKLIKTIEINTIINKYYYMRDSLEKYLFKILHK